jgi:Zn-dependent protease with chaperone function
MLLFLGLAGFLFPLLLTGGVMALGLLALAWTWNHSGGRWLGAKLFGGSVLLSLSMLRAMWIRYEKPAGRVLRREEAPLLFADCEEIAERLEGPRIDEVLIYPEMNAAIVQHPRLGMIGGLFGYYRNYLLLGLPYLETTPRDLMRATLAHEIGHFSRRHGQFGSWIHRCQLTWGRLESHFEYLKAEGNFLEKGVATVCGSFYGWLSPQFRGLALDQIRAHEFEADRAATEVTGARVNALSLANDVFMIERMQKFWSEFWERPRREEQPPENPYQLLFLSLRAPLPAEEVMAILDRAASIETGTEDTHPCFRERFVDTGLRWPEDRVAIEGDLAKGVERSSAEEYFRTELRTELAEELNGTWRTEALENWRTARANYAELERLGNSEEGEMALEDLLRKADLTARLTGLLEAEPIYRRVLERDPEHEHAQMMANLAASVQGQKT